MNRGRVAAVALLAAAPPIANHVGGLRLIWTAALPDAILHPLTEAGLLDSWVLLDLLAASGVLGAVAVAALATGARALAATLLAAIAVPSLAAVVAGLSLAAMTAGLSTLTFGYGGAYALATALTLPKGAQTKQEPPVEEAAPYEKRRV